MEKKKTQSYVCLISAMLIYGTIGIFRRYIPLSSGMLAFARGVMGAIVLIIYVKVKGGKIRHGIGLKKLLLLALSGGIMGANWILLFEAYNYTTVPVATLCYYMEPTIIIFLSPIVFKERLTVKKLICAVLSMSGMVLVSGLIDEGMQQVNGRGILLGLSAAALYATVVIMNKKVQVEDAYEKTIIQLASAAIVMIPYLLLTEDFSSIQIGTRGLIMLGIVGVIHTGFAYAMYFGSMKSLNAQSIAVLSYIDPVTALILSGVILHENLTVFGMAGAVLIIGSALVSELNISKE